MKPSSAPSRYVTLGYLTSFCLSFRICARDNSTCLIGWLCKFHEIML